MANTVSSHRVVVSKESLVKFPNVNFSLFTKIVLMANSRLLFTWAFGVGPWDPECEGSFFPKYMCLSWQRGDPGGECGQS